MLIVSGWVLHLQTSTFIDISKQQDDIRKTQGAAIHWKTALTFFKTELYVLDLQS